MNFMVNQMNKLQKNRKNKNKGFTLVELIIVIAIIAVLAAVLAPQYIKYVDKSKASVDVDTVAAIEQAVNVLCADGTISSAADNAVTWTKSTGALTGTYAEQVAGILGKTAGATGSETYSTNKGTSSKSADVKFSVTISNGTPSVSTTVAYKAWAA